MKRRSRSGAAALGLAVLLVASPGLAQTSGGAAGAIPAGGIPDVLRARVGKPITLQLRSGKEYGGVVGEVRADAVVLQSITGKEFYDALVRLDDISAIEIRRER